MVYKAIFFDYGGLLARCVCTPETTLRAHRKAQEAISRDGIEISVNDLTSRFSVALGGYLSARKELREWTLYEIIKSTLPEVPEDVLKVVTSIYRRHDHDSFVYDDVKVVLPELAASHTLGIVSDCPHDSLRDDLSEAGVLGLFRSITFSHEVGWRKPHSAIYETALARTQVDSKNSLFVSHDLTDLEGARNVGMDTLLVDRSAGESLVKIKEVLR